MLSGEAIQAVLMDVILSVQQACGRPKVNIDSKTRPIGDLPGFDSLNGLEATVELAHKLGIEIPEDINLFANERGTRALRIDEITRRVTTLLHAADVAKL